MVDSFVFNVIQKQYAFLQSICFFIDSKGQNIFNIVALYFSIHDQESFELPVLWPLTSQIHLIWIQFLPPFNQTFLLSISAFQKFKRPSSSQIVMAAKKHKIRVNQRRVVVTFVFTYDNNPPILKRPPNLQ